MSLLRDLRRAQLLGRVSNRCERLRMLAIPALQGFRAEGAPYVDANVTYAWTDAGGSQHQLSLAFQSGPGGYFVHTEWYVPGFEATTLGVMIGPDFALSVIYAAGDSPPLPCPPK